YIFSSTHINCGRPFLASHLPEGSLDPTYLIPDKNEVLQILKDMKLNASPGPDGFNVEFYLATWDWIGHDVTQLEALAAHSLQGILLGPNCPPIHSLLFADDLLVCGQATIQEANAMANIINHFCSVSGQTPN
uniref:Reverse transcriptase domain-containing protein n=1 Tax=Aegilops tauschii subsp. strangulata TaxID=200361 RepID=A0A452ZD82_AEGTS